MQAIKTERYDLSPLDRLEAESIHILREATAECARPVMMLSAGRDSSVLLHLARKAFHPGPIPFPMLVDSAGDRDEEAVRQHDVVIGNARREEGRMGAGERIFSLRDRHGQRDPKSQRPELWKLFNARVAPGESLWVFPLSNWTGLDVGRYIEREAIGEFTGLAPNGSLEQKKHERCF